MRDRARPGLRKRMLQVLSLGWDASASSDVAGYRIFQRLEGEVYNYQLPVAEVDANTLCTTIHDISDGSNVYFVCRAFDIHNLESINII